MRRKLKSQLTPVNQGVVLYNGTGSRQFYRQDAGDPSGKGLLEMTRIFDFLASYGCYAKTTRGLKIRLGLHHETSPGFQPGVNGLPNTARGKQRKTFLAENKHAAEKQNYNSPR